MKHEYMFRRMALICSLLFLPAVVTAQVTQADYERAAGLRNKYQGLTMNIVDRANWIGKTNHISK